MINFLSRNTGNNYGHMGT